MNPHKNKHPPQPHAYHFHPLEFSFCGFSGSGKTTLIEKLSRRWQTQGHHFAYLKHDAHQFQMDSPGKDTQRIKAAGATCIAINDRHHQVLLAEGSDLRRFHPYLLDYDFAVIEGFKTLAIPSLVMLDPHGEILAALPPENSSLHLAYIGPWHQPPAEIAARLHAPYFFRDDLDAISTLIGNFLQNKIAARPLKGLLLAGGRSQRMGEDKALLRYHEGQTQLQRGYDLLAAHCSEVFISLRDHHTAEAGEYSRFPFIADTFLNLGPLGGILTAMQRDPAAAWWVLAVDLPALSPTTLERLLGERDPLRYATAFRAQAGEFFEPLCTLYEPKCFAQFLTLLGQGLRCPTRMLQQLRIKSLLQEAGARDLMNVNTQEERRSFR